MGPRARVTSVKSTKQESVNQLVRSDKVNQWSDMGPTKMSKDWKDYWILSIKIGLDSTQQKTAIGVTKTFRKSFNIQFMAVTWTYWFSLQLIFSGQVGQWIWGKLVNGFVYNAPRAFGGGNSGAGDTKIISILLLWCFGVTMGVLEDTGMKGDKCKA